MGGSVVLKQLLFVFHGQQLDSNSGVPQNEKN